MQKDLQFCLGKVPLHSHLLTASGKTCMLERMNSVTQTQEVRAWGQLIRDWPDLDPFHVLSPGSGSSIHSGQFSVMASKLRSTSFPVFCQPNRSIRSKRRLSMKTTQSARPTQKHNGCRSGCHSWKSLATIRKERVAHTLSANCFHIDQPRVCW